MSRDDPLPPSSSPVWVSDPVRAPAGPGWRARLADRWATGARLVPSPTAALALVGVAAMVILVAVVSWWPQRSGGEPVPVAVDTPLTTTRPPDEPDRLVVSVVGRVHRPGLVTLTPGARVADALRAAGDLAADADPLSVNLARRVRDGEQVLVAVPGAAPADPAPAGTGPRGPSGEGGGSLVDLNTATVAALVELPGIGQVTAQRIIDRRDRHGAFRSVDELREVSGIGEAKLARLRELVTV